MCCLFGLMDYGRCLSGRQKTRLLSVLAQESEARGTDAAGISYNAGGQLHIYKRPGPAHLLRAHVPEDARVVMGHTRLTTQGDAAHNRNNHPFSGRVPGTRFALAHNGVLYNDLTLRKNRGLPATKIETDSYVAVQLLEQQGALTLSSLKKMAETVEGSFVFTVLDERDNLYFVKGDNPLCLVRFPQLGLCLYASTEAILQKSIARTWLGKERQETIPIERGNLVWADRQGWFQTDRFEVWEDFGPFWGCRRRVPARLPEPGLSHWYLEELKSVASAYGYTPDTIDELLRQGYSTDEVEEGLYALEPW